MYRSASMNRFSDDHYSYYGSSSPSSKVPTALRALSDDSANELPMYEPLSDAAKKERSRAKFAEKAVHAIPLVLLFCAFILWIFSNPDIKLRGTIAEEIKGMSKLSSDDTGHLPLHLGDLPGTANTIFSRNTP
ncbi:uncharacterized protein LOC121810487 [Salvia splendens]|uniref:uncharacterized protein LOC121810487 n=1 Tax=Salvia splendens TaxID=180675 RepID=UPI001C25531B|nr:uncharacterized protein LOC121810487 [Salvia splendens]